jgi:hypothetical protein
VGLHPSGHAFQSAWSAEAPEVYALTTYIFTIDLRLTAESTLVRTIFVCAWLILWRFLFDLWREKQATQTGQRIRVDDDWKKKSDEQQRLRWKKFNGGWFREEKNDAGCRPT